MTCHWRSKPVQTHAVLVDAEDNEQHQALLATMVGHDSSGRGNVMNKSANLNEAEPLTCLGIASPISATTFRRAVSLTRESNILYAMDASKPQFPQAEAGDRARAAKRVDYRGDSRTADGV